MTLTHVKTRRFTRKEYYRMAEAGVLARGERVELIDGEIVPMSPQNLPHSVALGKCNMLLAVTFAHSHIVRCQCPITLADACEPEPDFALVAPEHLEACTNRGIHPDCPDLVIEISDTSLPYDTSEKVALYARAAIPEYWVLSLRGRYLEVRRDSDPVGHNYRSFQIFQEKDSLAPSFAPEQFVRVTDLLP